MVLPSVGTKAPDFTLQDQDGVSHTLSHHKGQWVLIYFYPKDNTPGCTTEACSLREHFGELRKKLEVIGVSHDKVETHAKFASKYQLPFTLLSDPKKEIIQAFKINRIAFRR